MDSYSPIPAANASWLANHNSRTSNTSPSSPFGGGSNFGAAEASGRNAAGFGSAASYFYDAGAASADAAAGAAPPSRPFRYGASFSAAGGGSWNLRTSTAAGGDSGGNRRGCSWGSSFSSPRSSAAGWRVGGGAADSCRVSGAAGSCSPRFPEVDLAAMD